MCPYLLPGKYVLIEVKLYLFICNVNAELFKGILFEILKTEDIQNPNAVSCVILAGKIKQTV